MREHVCMFVCVCVCAGNSVNSNPFLGSYTPKPTLTLSGLHTVSVRVRVRLGVTVRVGIRVSVRVEVRLRVKVSVWVGVSVRASVWTRFIYTETDANYEWIAYGQCKGRG